MRPCELAPKDGLSLINASAVSAGHGALVVADALAAFGQQQQAGALTMEGFGANRSILDPRLQAARPAAGQQEAARQLRDLLAGGDPPTPANAAGSAVDPLHAVDPWRAARRRSAGRAAPSRSSSTAPPTIRWCWPTTMQ